MNKDELGMAKLVVFSILMQNRAGIIGKAPGYIAEKWEAIQACSSLDYLLGLLDQQNKKKYSEWTARWREVT